MDANTLSVIRAILMFGGGLLVSKGVVSSDQLPGLVDTLLIALGSIMGAGALVLSIWRNHQNKAAQAVAAVTGAPVKVEALKVPTVANSTPSASGPTDMNVAAAAPKP